MDITNKVALVTGGASGLGLATVRSLQAAGAAVVIADLPSSKGEDVAAEIGATFAAADVTSEEQVGAAIATASGLGPLSVVVNCAGIANARRVVAKDGTVFVLQPEAVRGSPLDVPPVKLKLTRDEVVDFVREGRRPA